MSGVIPPYWHRHERNASHVSQSSLSRGAPITLEDHTADPNSETSRGLWARSVSIDDHVVVQGMTGVGSYVVWNCTIYTLDVSYDRGLWEGIYSLYVQLELASDICVTHAGCSNCCSDEVCLTPVSCSDDVRQLTQSFPF